MIVAVGTVVIVGDAIAGGTVGVAGVQEARIITINNKGVISLLFIFCPVPFAIIPRLLWSLQDH